MCCLSGRRKSEADDLHPHRSVAQRRKKPEKAADRGAAKALVSLHIAAAAHAEPGRTERELPRGIGNGKIRADILNFRIAGRDGSILPVENAIDGGQIHAPANGVGKQVILLLLICAQVERPERGGVETAAIAEGL